MGLPPRGSDGSSPESLDPATGRATAPDRAARVRYRRALMLMVMTLVVPGSAQLVAGNRRLGRLATRLWAALLVAGAVGLVLASFHHQYVFWFVSDTTVLGILRLGLMLLAVGWALLFLDAWRIGQPLSLALGHRRAVVGLNGILCFSVAGALLFGAHLVGVQRSFILTMFSGDTVHGANDGRYNVLLVGGDSGAGRWGLRTDSMTVASIDADTGKTVLIGLPRNMTDFPFAKGSVMHKAWPHGFNCGYPNCELNGVNTWVGDHQKLFKGVEEPGHGRHDLGDRGHHRAEDQLLVVREPGRVPRSGRRRRRRHPACAAADPRRRARRRRDRVHQAGHPQAQRLRHALVRPLTGQLRRLLADGAAEVRDERDAAPAQPADGAHQLREDRHGLLGDGLDRHPGQ